MDGYTVLYLLSAICFAVGVAVNVAKTSYEMAILCAGLLLWVLVPLLMALDKG